MMAKDDDWVHIRTVNMLIVCSKRKRESGEGGKVLALSEH